MITARIPATSPKKGPVTIVDSDVATRAFIRSVLESSGYEVIEHERWRDAADAVERALVVCVEVGSGDAPGPEVVRDLQAKDKMVPIIVVSAENMVDRAHAAMDLGAYDFLTKPIDRARLEGAIRRAVERRELTRSLSRLRGVVEKLMHESAAHQHQMPNGVGQQLVDLANELQIQMSNPPPSGDVVPLRELERRAIAQALRATSGSVGKAAKLLGMGRATLYRRIAESGGIGTFRIE